MLGVGNFVTVLVGSILKIIECLVFWKRFKIIVYSSILNTGANVSTSIMIHTKEIEREKRIAEVRHAAKGNASEIRNLF